MTRLRDRLQDHASWVVLAWDWPVPGFAGTTVWAIAAEARVVVSTVCKAFGIMADIARELNDPIDV